MELRSRRVLSSPTPDGAEQQHSDCSNDDIDSPVYLSHEDTYVPSSNSDSDSSCDEGRVSLGLDGGSSKSNLDMRRGKKREKKRRKRCDNVGETSIQLDGDHGGSDGQKSISQSNKKAKNAKKEHKPILMWHLWEEENESWLDAHLSEDVDLDDQSAVLAETAEEPCNLTMPLLRYQKEWLGWALKQEESPTRGGILADEMGMGKTIQAIALVLAKREICQIVGEDNVPSSSAGALSASLPKIRSTLVICPLVAVTQWASEINRFTLEGTTKVLVYHGANRGKNLKHLSEYDFVITTYSIVESEYRKLMPSKEKCCYCGRIFNQKKLSYHLKYFCGPDAVKTEQQSKQQKKVVKNVQPKLKLGTDIARDKASRNGGHMKKRPQKKPLKQNKEGKEPKPQANSLLHSVIWERIILDEAHFVKDRRCNTAKAVFALNSSYKWALSGTPLQNRVGELYSLVRFLQIVPYSYYLCKDCDCRTLDYSSSTQCPDCPHKSVRHFCWWNKYVATPIRDFAHLDYGKRAMILLKHRILKNILLRRTKKGRAADLALPPRIVTLRRDTLDIKEEDYYEALYNESQAQFNTYVQAGTVTNNYAHIFDLLTRLRQAVDHPYLVVYSKADNVASSLRNGSMINADSNEQICGICHDPAEDPVVTSCEHVFCKACLIDFSTSRGQVSCPSCSRLLTVDLTRNADSQAQSAKTALKGFRSSSILNRIKLDDFQTSTKIDALREEIRFMVERDGSAKGIVFSQFTSFLDLINYSLQKSGVKCVQLVGSMSMTARDAAIKQFTDDPDCRIFLMSLKAGGVALNLTVASHVFLMDPWWNPAVERQAQDRIHRIGQYKPIRVVRFVIENTIEERILKLQEKKELVFEGTVGGSSEALGKLTEADMKFLFVT